MLTLFIFLSSSRRDVRLQHFFFYVSCKKNGDEVSFLKKSSGEIILFDKIFSTINQNPWCNRSFFRRKWVGTASFFWIRAFQDLLAESLHDGIWLQLA